MDIQSTTISGRLAAAPELKYGQGRDGAAFLKLRCASNYYDPQADGNKGTLWITVVIFGKRAEAIGKFDLNKGDQIVASGRLRVSEWVGRDGDKMTSIELHAQDVEQVGRRSGGGDEQRQERGPRGGDQRHERGRREPPPKEPQKGGYEDDDIPF